MHDWGYYPGDEVCHGGGDGIAAIMRNMDKPPPRNSLKKEEKLTMPDTLYFVTWCDPKKYNVGNEQEYEWFQDEKNALAKVGQLTLDKQEHVAMHIYLRKK
ncbi:MAG: hypothetical protein M0R80_00590 [Proteobacteria bacterium]|jgi:hypothetical protein|nr:hypothetical protein [Pseudomonadota bacterium]